MIDILNKDNIEYSVINNDSSLNELNSLIEKEIRNLINISKMKKYLSLIKFSHTIFAMPFALIGFFLASQQSNIEWITLVYVVLCMVFARSAAMAFNRYIDRDIDTANPRTAEIREIPNGSIKANFTSCYSLKPESISFEKTTIF